MRKPLLLLVPVVLMALVFQMLWESTEQLPASGDAPRAEQSEATPGLAGPRPGETPGNAGPDRTELRVAEPANAARDAILSGVVVDETGVPFPGVPLRTSETSTYIVVGSTRATSVLTPTWATSGEDGTFILRRRDFGGRSTRIALVSNNRSGLRILSEDLLFDWGTEGIRIVVSRPQTWVLTVVEEGTGAPVEEFDWRLELLSASSYAKRQGWGEHEGGRVEMAPLEYGKHRLLVFPLDEELVPIRPREIEVGAGGGEVRIELQRRRALTVRVLRGDRSPVRGTEVELLRNEGREELQLHSSTGPADVNFTGSKVGSILDSGDTDAWGEVVLRGPRGGDLAVKVVGPGHAPELVTNVSLKNDEVLVIEVRTGATLAGSFQPVSLLESITANLTSRERERDRYHPRLFLSKDPGGARFPIGPRETVAIQADGSFQIERIPPGSWEVYLSLWDGFTTGSSTTTFLLRHKLATVRNLKDGEMRRITLDASELVPGRITGQIFLDGQPYTNGRFGLRQRAFDSTSPSVSYTIREGLTTDADGGFSSETQSGLVSVFVTPDGSTAGLSVQIVGIQELQVQPGQASAGVFHLVHVRMRVRFLEHDGTPATERYFSLDRYGNGRSDVRTNSEGWLVVDPAPTVPVRFHTWPKRMDTLGAVKRSQEERNQLSITVGPVQMPAGAVDAEFTLRLPDDGS
jgi:hypothetical protein